MKTSKIKGRRENFGIKDLMFIISMANLLVYVLSVFGNTNLSLALALIPEKVLQGEVWRIISYIFIPPTFNPFFFVLVIYFYVFIGRELERYWGTFKFNIYYFTGVAIISLVSMVFNVPVTSISNLNMSLFLAYAILNSEHIVYLFMIIPVKMKYLAIVMSTIIVYDFINAGFWQLRIVVLAPIINLLIFFVPRFIKNTSSGVKARKRTQEFESKVLKFEKEDSFIHKCYICGKTDRSDENMEFRYCSKCNGHYEYCNDHIFDHEHK